MCFKNTKHLTIELRASFSLGFIISFLNCRGEWLRRYHWLSIEFRVKWMNWKEERSHTYAHLHKNSEWKTKQQKQRMKTNSWNTFQTMNRISIRATTDQESCELYAIKIFLKMRHSRGKHWIRRMYLMK